MLQEENYTERTNYGTIYIQAHIRSFLCSQPFFYFNAFNTKTAACCYTIVDYYDVAMQLECPHERTQSQISWSGPPLIYNHCYCNESEWCSPYPKRFLGALQRVPMVQCLWCYKQTFWVPPPTGTLLCSTYRQVPLKNLVWDGFLYQVICLESQTATFLHIGIPVGYSPISGMWCLSIQYFRGTNSKLKKKEDPPPKTRRRHATKPTIQLPNWRVKNGTKISHNSDLVSLRAMAANLSPFPHRLSSFFPSLSVHVEYIYYSTPLLLLLSPLMLAPATLRDISMKELYAEGLQQQHSGGREQNSFGRSVIASLLIHPPKYLTSCHPFLDRKNYRHTPARGVTALDRQRGFAGWT